MSPTLSDVTIANCAHKGSLAGHAGHQYSPRSPRPRVRVLSLDPTLSPGGARGRGTRLVPPPPMPSYSHPTCYLSPPPPPSNSVLETSLVCQHVDILCTWRLSWLVVGKRWLSLAGSSYYPRPPFPSPPPRLFEFEFEATLSIHVAFELNCYGLTWRRDGV